MLDLEVVVVVFDLGPQLDFLEVRDVLLPPRLLLLLVLLVLELPEVHHPAHRRLGGGRDLDEIELALLRVGERFADAQDSDLLPIRPDDADRRNSDAVVDADLFAGGDRLPSSAPDYGGERTGGDGGATDRIGLCPWFTGPGTARVARTVSR